MFKRILMASALCSAVASASAQPDPLTIVVSFTPGGPVDFVARTIAERLGKEVGRPVVVENKPGANGAIGAMEVVRAKPDGQTVWLTSVGAAAVNSSLYPSLAYDMKRDFAPVSMVVNNVELLVANPNDPATNAVEFVAAAKTRSEPMAMASSGIGSIPHLAIEQLSESTGARLLHAPYKGAAPAITDLMGGQVSGFFGDVAGLLSYVRSGKLKALGVASSSRHPSLPDVKTLEEQGIKGVDTANWYALFAPSKTPPETIAKLNQAIRTTLADPVVHERLVASGAEPAPSSPEELAQRLDLDTRKWAVLIKSKGIKVE